MQSADSSSGNKGDEAASSVVTKELMPLTASRFLYYASQLSFLTGFWGSTNLSPDASHN